MKRNKIQAMIIATLITFLSIQAASSFTWDDSVQPGSWVKYNVSLNIRITPPVPVIEALNIIYLTYEGTVNISVDAVDTIAVNFTTTSVDGNLAGLIDDMGLIGDESSIIPDELIVLPQEIIANDTLSFGNVTIPFEIAVEMDHTKFWRGIPVKTIDLSETGIFDSMPIDFLGFLTGGSEGAIQLSTFFKYDNSTGWFYQLNFNLDVSTPSEEWMYTWLSIKMDISMIDASQGIKDAMEENRDHSLDLLFISQDIFLSPWFPVFLLGIIIAVFIVVVSIMKARGSINLPKITTKKQTPETPAKPKPSDKYRKGKEVGGTPSK